MSQFNKAAKGAYALFFRVAHITSPDIVGAEFENTIRLNTEVIVTGEGRSEGLRQIL